MDLPGLGLAGLDLPKMDLPGIDLPGLDRPGLDLPGLGLTLPLSGGCHNLGRRGRGPQTCHLPTHGVCTEGPRPRGCDTPKRPHTPPNPPVAPRPLPSRAQDPWPAACGSGGPAVPPPAPPGLAGGQSPARCQLAPGSSSSPSPGQAGRSRARATAGPRLERGGGSGHPGVSPCPQRTPGWGWR